MEYSKPIAKLAKQIPACIKEAVSVLERAGHTAYIVGGSLRDIMLGNEPHDWDLTTSARPEQTLAAFSGYRTVPTGIKHGTVSVIIGTTLIEITTYRIDGVYSDSRHPDSVRFTDRISDDLARRDFTVNSMAYSESKGLVDLYGGRADLENRIIRCVGEPEQRFREDALRILRALRFAAKLGFEIDKNTLDAMEKCRAELANISRERIASELYGLLCGVAAEHSLELMCRTGVDRYVFVQRDDSPLPYRNISLLPCQAEVRIAYLLRNETDAQKTASEIMHGLRASSASASAVTVTVGGVRSELPEPEPKNVRRFMNMYGSCTDSVLAIRSVIAQSDREKRQIDLISGLVRAEAESGNCRTLGALKIKGNDITDSKIASGKAVGIILSRLLDEVIDCPEKNDRAYLLARAHEIAPVSDANNASIK